MKKIISYIVFFVSTFWMIPGYTDEDNTDWSGKLTLQPTFGGYQNRSIDFEFQPKVVHEWEGNNSFIAELKLRLDLNEDNRNLLDIQELNWKKYWDEWDLGLGWQIVTPVQRTEAIHLVDSFFNQRDLAGNIDGEDKLGQLMVSGAYLSDKFGTLELFAMPYTPKRTFSDMFPITDSAEFEDGQFNLSTAVRWSNSIDKLKLDFGLTHFFGTSREPELIPRLTPNGLDFTQFYPRVNQTGIDWQWQFGKYLFKGEAIHVSGGSQTYNALTYGLERTFWNVKDSGIDVTWIVEHLYDDRHDEFVQPFNNDLAAFVRVGKFNWEVLFGPIVDPSSRETFLNLEYERRLTTNGKWTLEAEARFAVNDNDRSAFKAFKDYVRVGLSYNF